MSWKLALATADDCLQLLNEGWEPFQVSYIPEAAVGDIGGSGRGLLSSPVGSPTTLMPVFGLKLWVDDRDLGNVDVIPSGAGEFDWLVPSRDESRN